MNDGVDEAGWDVEPGDEIEPVVQAVGRLLRVCREAAGMSVSELAEALGYGEDMIRKIERGARIPRPELLDRADQLLKAQGHLRAFMEDMRKARYPKKVRELAELEGRAVEMLLYGSHNIHGLLQTPEYARTLFEMTQPALSEDVMERETAARMARKAVFECEPTPTLSFVQEQVTLERPYGGKMVLRRQLEHLLEVAQLRNVTLQVMPTDREEHAGTQGLIQVLKFADGTAIGRSDGAFNGRPVSHPKDLRILELRYGMIRAQALTPRESQAFIERTLGRL
ncbi:transcriptional regulator with XRE-family HTH domain [Streptomyces griseochromogenes]|uniref:Transcriptional regulator n=1 Tax=Streptomyces griseochromogenes TaxID=68214 RepID=A0A1B1B9Z3_9ACTN|nr:helix-turn-helix transcriptional regulator [Streptomyces griseochromogenes]ANP55589.1 transcriptional regulator [Streptomyces griseochromogenes]MBP2053449.1 transcriptional regulator with XRE-family HTH domain [Streptomyces griseochromogenes]